MTSQARIKTLAPQFRGIPALDIDAILYADGKIPASRRLEERIVWNLCKHLAANGWTPVNVWDGCCNEKALTAKAVMELVFNLDEAWVSFTNGRIRHSIFLVCGNGCDIISDWRYSAGDPDAFDATVSAFDSDRLA